MDTPSLAELKQLLACAAEMVERSYAPYSRLRVGAALLSKDGRIFRGCNVENAAYGLTICAEQAAVCRAVAEGVRDWRAIAIRAWNGEDWADPCLPCGACRQVLAEFQPDLIIVTADPGRGGDPRVDHLDRLFTKPFRYR